MFISKMLTATFLVALAVVISCQTPNTSSQATGSSQGQPKAQSEKPFDFLAEAPSYLGQIQLLTPAQRLALFQGLAAGKTDGLTKLVGSRGAQFLQALYKIDGYRQNGWPSVGRLEALYQTWAQSSGEEDKRLFALYKFWRTPRIKGFSMTWVKDLPTKKQDGRTYEGWRLGNDGSVVWPETLEIEPLMAVPTSKDLVLPKPVRISPITPGTTIDVYVDVTEFAGHGNLYFISTFMIGKTRCYIKPRPELGLGTIPEDALYVTFR